MQESLLEGPAGRHISSLEFLDAIGIVEGKKYLEAIVDFLENSSRASGSQVCTR